MKKKTNIIIHEEKYITKDSGKRRTWKSGFNRDDDGMKLRYDLIPIQMLERIAGLYTRGAKKYGDCNWQKAETQEEFDRFKQSAWRHFISWQKGQEDEDHASATIWNLMAYEWLTKYKNEK